MYFNIYFLLKTGSFSSNRHVSLPEGSPSWKLMVSPNHPILIGFAIIDHPFCGELPYFRKHPCSQTSPRWVPRLEVSTGERCDAAESRHLGPRGTSVFGSRIGVLLKSTNKKWYVLLMEEIRLTSWYGKYPIIYRVSNIFYFHPHLIREGFPFWRLYSGNPRDIR